MNREEWKKAFERWHRKYWGKYVEPSEAEKHVWIKACEYMEQMQKQFYDEETGLIFNKRSVLQLVGETERLQKKLDIAIKALEFYGDSAKWEPTDSIIQMPTFMVADDCEKIDCSRAYWGGRMARETLEELKDEK